MKLSMCVDHFNAPAYPSFAKGRFLFFLFTKDYIFNERKHGCIVIKWTNVSNKDFLSASK